MSVYVYALASGVARVAGTGISGERLRRIRIGAIDAIVGDVVKPPRPTRTNLLHYDRVLTSLWERSAALLPARFGTVVRDRAELEFILDARQDTFRRQLKIVRNRAQMTIRMMQGAGGRGQGEANTQPRSRMPDAAFRGRSYLKARAADAQHVPEFVPVRQGVRRWVRAEGVEKHGDLATIYHLVPRGAVDRYRQAIDRAARAADVRLLVSGPWPPYAFAESW